MVHSTIKRSASGVKMETFEKFSSIPLIESGLNTGLKVYNRVKRTNRLVYWYLETSENVALSMIEAVKPAVNFISGPLESIDKLGLKVLDHVEEKMPTMMLPPQLIYWNTKEYVSDHVVKPVLKRADSFGDIVDGAIEKADHALDKYLPDKDGEESETEQEENVVDLAKRNHAFQTYRRSKRLSKKFKHKISIRTFNEINALKNDVHILIYAAELIATNPKEAYKKFNELWAYFSKNEPENQKRPETLEELFVLLVRESARKMVHLVNFTTRQASKIPRKLKSTVRDFFHHVLYTVDYLLKIVHIERIQDFGTKLSTTYDETMQRLAIFFSGRLEAEKIQMSSIRQSIYTRPSSINGLY